MKANIQNNKLYLLVEGKEQQLAMGLDGKLVIFPDWSICDMNSRSRAREVSIPTTLTMEQWNTVDKINSKLEIIEKATL